MTKQFFNEENIPIKNKTIKEEEEEEKLAKENVEIAITEALLNEDLKNIKNEEVKEEKENKNKTFHLPSEKRLKNGPLGWLGITLIIFGLFLLIFDAFTNYLSQSNFGVSASLFSILLSVLNFISASRWPERISLIILLPFCTLTSFLFAFLGIESGQKLIIQPIPLGINCPPTKQFLPLIWFKWLKNSSITNIRRCINPAINSILLCFALIGGLLF